VIFVELHRLRPFKLAADELEHDVKLTGNAESRAHRDIVDLTRTEVLEHGGMSIQKRLDVDEFPGPASLLEDALAASEPRRL
jgi:hypothetical protein